VNQSALFHDSLSDAIGADIAAAGGFKAVAAKLWPTDAPGAATAKLRNSLNPEQPHKLCPEELLAIKRMAHECGSDATVQYEASQLGFAVSWLDPRDEADELRRRVLDAADELKRLFSRLERADERVLKAVR
jgi:hypothetical protein